MNPRLALALIAGTALGACHPKPLGHMGRPGGVHVSDVEPTKTAITVARRLTCPQAVGVWTRTAQAADGQGCSYTGPKGQVDLALLSGAAGDPQALLAPERARLDGQMPGALHGGVQVIDERSPDGREVQQVDLPFIHVHRDGDRKSVQVFGMHVDKTGRDDEDKVGNDVKEQAPPAAKGAGTKLVYILAGDPPAPGGWHAIGYDARVDASGRALVARFRYAQGEHADERDENGLDPLIALNVSSEPAAAADTNDADQ